MIQILSQKFKIKYKYYFNPSKNFVEFGVFLGTPDLDTAGRHGLLEAGGRGLGEIVRGAITTTRFLRRFRQRLLLGGASVQAANPIGRQGRLANFMVVPLFSRPP